MDEESTYLNDFFRFCSANSYFHFHLQILNPIYFFHYIGGYGQFAALKTYNRDLKTLIAIGGWNEGSKRFSPLVADPKRRRTFIRSAIRFLRQYNFDGLGMSYTIKVTKS